MNFVNKKKVDHEKLSATVSFVRATIMHLLFELNTA